MENQVNIMEIAQYCKNEFEQRCNNSDYMSSYTILYIAISNDEKMRISRTPHILADAKQCYLVHMWAQKAVSCWYDTYEVQSINSYGEVGSGQFDDEYSFSISAAGFNRSPEIYLKRNNNILYSSRLWDYGHNAEAKMIEYVWDLYNKCKSETKTQFESELLCKLASKDETIRALEKRLEDITLKEQYIRDEVREYRNLLDEIKLAIKTDA